MVFIVKTKLALWIFDGRPLSKLFYIVSSCHLLELADESCIGLLQSFGGMQYNYQQSNNLAVFNFEIFKKF